MSDVQLAQENYSLEEITQLLEWQENYSPEFSNLKVSCNMQEPAQPGEICVFPIDFQSTPIDSIIYNVEKSKTSKNNIYIYLAFY